MGVLPSRAPHPSRYLGLLLTRGRSLSGKCVQVLLLQCGCDTLPLSIEIGGLHVGWISWCHTALKHYCNTPASSIRIFVGVPHNYRGTHEIVQLIWLSRAGTLTRMPTNARTDERTERQYLTRTGSRGRRRLWMHSWQAMKRLIMENICRHVDASDTTRPSPATRA